MKTVAITTITILLLTMGMITNAFASENVPLSGQWQLAVINGESVAADANITLNIYGAQMDGFGGCNTYLATVTSGAGTIEIAGMIASMEWCSDTSAMEETYLGSLGQVKTWSTDGVVLKMASDDASTSLEFIQAVTPQAESVPTAVGLGMQSATASSTMLIIVTMLGCFILTIVAVQKERLATIQA